MKKISAFIVLLIIAYGAVSAHPVITSGSAINPDTHPNSSSTPTVVSVSHQNAVNVSTSANITVTFSESMDATTFVDSTVVISGSLRGVFTGAVSYDDPTRTLTFNPSSDFFPGEIISVNLTTEIESSLGVGLANSYSFSFRVAATGYGNLEFADSVAIDHISVKDFVSKDVDNDGDVDILTRSGTANQSITVYTNAGGTLSEFFTTSGQYLTRKYEGDIDGDGDVDVLVKARNQGYVVGVENDGTGDFSFRDTTVLISSQNRNFYLSDFDGDGKLDFWYKYHFSDSINIMYWGNGDFTFSAPDTILSTIDINNIATGDIDNDGDMDFVGNDSEGLRLQTLLNNGDRTFSVGNTISGIETATNTANKPKLEDLNADGYLDIVMSANDNGFYILLNNSDGTFADPVNYFKDSIYELNKGELLDFDGDGDIDLAFEVDSGDEGTGLTIFSFNDGNGRFGNETFFKFSESFIEYTNLNSLTIADFDGDGDLDLMNYAYGNEDDYFVFAENTPAIVTTPDTAASALQASTLTVSASLSWTNGNGSRRLVIVKEGSEVDVTPSDDFGYSANSTFGDGLELGTGNFVVYSGFENYTEISGLSANTTYHVQVFELNGIPGTEKILTTGAPATSFTTRDLPAFWTTANGTLTFTKEDNADFTLEENQDRITDSIWITRQNGGGGLFNYATEEEYSSDSPDGTLWAVGSIDTLMGTPENLQNLEFRPFRESLGNSIGNVLSDNTTKMVLFLDAENTLVDITFTSWTKGGDGGFSYIRALAPVELIQQADTTFTSFSDSTFSFTTDNFDFGGNYADSTLRIRLQAASTGNLYIDANDNLSYDAETDTLIGTSPGETYNPNSSSPLRYSAAKSGMDSLIIILVAAEKSDTIKFAMINVEATPEFSGNNGENGWYLLSNPINTPIGTLLDNVWTQGAINADSPGGDATLYRFNNDSARYEAITTELDTTYARAGEGILVYLFEDNDLGDGESDIDGGWPKTLQNYGNPFGTDATISIKNVDIDDLTGTSASEGFALLGNPFSWSLSADSVIATLKREDSNANSYVYRWNPTGKAYQLLLSGAIDPYEAVFVRVISSGVTANLSFDYEDSDASILSKKMSDSRTELLLTNLEKGLESSSYLRFDLKGDTEIDSYDGYYLGSYATEYANLYTLIGDQALTINNLPESFSGSEAYPIYLDATISGSFKLSWDAGNIPDGITVELLNTKNGEIIDMKEVSETGFSIENKEKRTFTLGPMNHLSAAVKAKQKIDPIFILTVSGTGVHTGENDLGIPKEVELFQNYPNPFNPSSVIRYGVPIQARVQLEVFDVLGRKVMTLIDGEIKQPGRFNASFNARELASGIYIYRLVIGDDVKTKKMTLIK